MISKDETGTALLAPHGPKAMFYLGIAFNKPSPKSSSIFIALKVNAAKPVFEMHAKATPPACDLKNLDESFRRDNPPRLGIKKDFKEQLVALNVDLEVPNARN